MIYRRILRRFLLLNQPISVILNAMKRIIICICLLLIFAISSTIALDMGEKIYKEVIIDGQKVNKWVEIGDVIEYDANGNIIYSKCLNSEVWSEFDDRGNIIYEKFSDGEEIRNEYEYDKKGNIIHAKSSRNDGSEHVGSYEYDTKGNIIHEKSSRGSEIWYEYDAKGNIIHEKKSNGYEAWYEYDAKGKKIHYKSSDLEWWYEYDAKGNIIHSKSSFGDENWYEYEYWKNGKVKKETQYLTF